MQFLTIREVAKTGLLAECHLRRLEREGKLPGVYSGRKKLVNVEKLIAYLDSESEARNG